MAGRGHRLDRHRAYVDPNASRISFREYAEQWRAAQVHRPNSQAHVETMLRRHAYPTFGDRPLASIVPSEVQVWVRRLSDGGVGRKPLAPATVAGLHSVVSSIMKAAVRDRRIPSNPCEGTRLPKKERRQVVPPTTEQVTLLAETVPPELRGLVIFVAGTGVRQGEAMGLTLDRVDLERREVRIERQLIRVVDGGVKTVQARLGHASAAETLDTYSHLWPDSDDRTREAVDQVLGSSCGLSADC